jgi:hypothetical protein
MVHRSACRGCGRTLALCSCPSGEDELGEGPSKPFNSFGSYHSVPRQPASPNVNNGGTSESMTASENMMNVMKHAMKAKVPLHSGMYPPHPATAHNVQLYPSVGGGCTAVENPL